MNALRLQAHEALKARRLRMMPPPRVVAAPLPEPVEVVPPLAVVDAPARYRLPGLTLPPTGRARRIVARVAEHYGVGYDDLRGQSRSKRVVLARQVAMVLVGRVLGYASARVAGALAREDHTTALCAVRSVAARAVADPAFAAELEALEVEVRGMLEGKM